MKKFFKRHTPSASKMKERRFIKVFGGNLSHTPLWSLTRHSVPGAFAIGLFWAFFPIPGQMLVAILFAIYFKKNIPISVSLIWITNPLTIPPILFFNYRLGAFLLGLDSIQIKFEPSTRWLIDILHAIWWPLLFGSFVVATLLSLAGYYVTTWLWRLSVVIAHRKRLNRNKEKAPQLPFDGPPSFPTS